MKARLCFVQLGDIDKIMNQTEIKNLSGPQDHSLGFI